MKRFTIFLALSLVVAMPMMAERVTPETARKVATTFLNNNGAKTTQLTDLSKEAGFQNLYIFTAEQGFVVMSADDCVQPILGYSLTGKFVAEDMPENLRWWLQGYNDEIQYTIDNQLPSLPETKKQWKVLLNNKTDIEETTIIVSPLIESNWNQDPPFNNLCPTGCVTGCVATAMAQIMRFHQYPSHGIGSHQYNLNATVGILSADFGSTNYDWGNIKLDYSSNEYSNEEATAVATLMYHCGVSAEMKYAGSSGTTIKRASVGLQAHFNYNASYSEKKEYDESDWISLLKTNINNRLPVLYGGQGSPGGHAFVCDGYDSQDNFHFNWGWGYIGEGYYSINDHSFPNDQCAVFNIAPASCLASAPADLVCTSQNGCQIDLSWAAANGAVSYNVFRNNCFLANTHETSFSDCNATLGINKYYVRSVDSENNSSLSSNCVSDSVAYQEPVVNSLKLDYSNPNASLSWATPWWHPQTTSGVVAYVDDYRPNLDQFIYWDPGIYCLYWGVRHLAIDLADYQGKALYKIAFYVYTPATYEVLVYQGTDSQNDLPVNLKATQSITTAGTGWIEIDLDEPVFIDSNEDLWIFLYNPDGTVKTIPCKDVDYQGYGNYYSYDYAFNRSLPHERCYSLPSDIKTEWFIRAFLTDDYYTYDLYDNSVQLTNTLSETQYTVSAPSDSTAHFYTITTHYNGGVSTASNTAGLILGTASLNSLELGENDQMTIAANSKLTVNGTLTDTVPDNLILESGAQLIHSSEGVQATVLKDITPYTEGQNDGWNFIASPVMENFEPREDNGFLNGSNEANIYDLYYYDEPTHLWKNFEAQTFEIEHKKGYLYANGETGGTTLEFVGTLLPSNNAVTISNLSHESEGFNGFNLVGNPFACNAIVDQDYYVINSTTNTVTLPPQGHVIAPCEAVFVQATEGNTSVTFSKSETRSSNNSFDITLSQGRAYLDRARVRLDEGHGLEKYKLHGEKDPQLYFPQNGRDYVVACTNGQNEMPVNFMAAKNDTYTLAIDTEDLDLEYLHLIDNMTGEDVDLLTTPSYTFEAKYSDYPSRFRLLFAPICENAVDDNETFAHVDANNNIIISGPSTSSGTAMLQIVDMMGRVIVCSDVARNVSTTSMIPGVYVLRLIDGENVRTQKIVIE